MSGPLRTRVDRLEQSIQVDATSPVVRDALILFLDTGKLPEKDDRVLGAVLEQAEFALRGFDELGEQLTRDAVARACERGASRYFMGEPVELPADIAERLARVEQLLAERRGPIDPEALAYL